MLRSGADLRQAGRVRHPAAGEEGVLRARLQRRPGGTAVGLEAPRVCRHANDHRFHQDSKNVLQITERVDGRARGAQAGHLAK